jgi:hypothetical protein
MQGNGQLQVTDPSSAERGTSRCDLLTASRTPWTWLADRAEKTSFWDVLG